MNPADPSALTPERRAALEAFARRLGLSAPTLEHIDWQLLHQALIHPSWAGENGQPSDNDRLEFLGDEVLRLVAAEYLYRTHPELPVGELSAVRSVLVSDAVLARWAERDELGACLLISRAHVQDGQVEARCLADAFEAVLGALYLMPGDLSMVTDWLLPRLGALTAEVLADPARRNYKSALQELTQKHYAALPDYRQVAIGPPFVYEVWVDGVCHGRGTGPSKKAAQQAAARRALESLAAANHGDY